jgi:tetratricopeptide (TPR) repeat protein
MFEQKLAEAKAKRHKRFINLVIGFVTISLLCGVVIFFTSCCQINPEEAEAVFPDLAKETEKNVVAVNPAQSQTVPDEQLRQSYINALNDYEYSIEPELNKIDLTKWDKSRSDRLATLQEEALSKFSIADYASALNYIEDLKQLALAMIADSQQQFEEAFSNAQDAYDVDSYDDARFHMANALMLNNQSEEAATLSSKIDKLPDILPLLEKANTARVENNHEKELSFIKEIIKLVPERESAVERKRILVDIIDRKNFKSNIAQSYQAIEQSNAGKAKQRLIAAKKIYPNRQEIGDVTIALQELEKKQRLEKYQQEAQTAIASDDWVTAKQQLELALRERVSDKFIQKSLAKATTIIALINEFDQHIDNPYRLSNKQVASKAKDKIAEANTFIDISPSLNKKTDTLSRLVESMNKKVSVEIVSDNQTNIIVRGVGVVGITQSKTIQLTPGRYKFEGKREGFKSKLIDVLIPYDKTSYRLNVICDEPI